MLANGEQFLLLITHPLSYSYTQWSPEIYRNAIKPFIALYDDIIFLYTLITINLSYVDIFIHKLYLIAQVKKEHKEVKKHKHITQGWINNFNYTKNLTLHIFYYIKVIDRVRLWVFYGKFADEEDNMAYNPNIYNEEEDNRLFTSYEGNNCILSHKPYQWRRNDNGPDDSLWDSYSTSRGIEPVIIIKL